MQGPDGDEITFAGQRGVFNNISLDGGDYNNGFFGEQMGGQRAAVDITLEAVKEFQVVATGANAEFGRTAGGVVNVITKSGTNQVKGSLFHFQRLEGLTSNTSDGKPLTDFHREQFGGTVGGPLVKNKAFFFGAVEGIREHLLRANLADAIGTPCAVGSPTLAANEALINASPDCQRLALLSFFRGRGQEEGLPVAHDVNNTASLAKLDWNLGAGEQSVGHLQLRLLEESQPDLRRRHLRQLRQRHGGAVEDQHPERESVQHRDRQQAERVSHHLLARESSAIVDAFGDTRRHRYRVRPVVQIRRSVLSAAGVDELVKRFQIKDNFSIVTGKHTIKTGGEWLHTDNVQVFRGFFQGRYLFDSVTGFLRYTSPAAAGGFGPNTLGCSDVAFNVTYVTAPASCPAGTTAGGPLLFYLQSSSPDGIARDAAGFSDIANEELAFFIQDKWQVGRGLTIDYGLRWDAQLMPETVDPTDHGVRAIPERSALSLRRHDSRSEKTGPAALRLRVGRQPGCEVGGARQRRAVLRPPEHVEPGRLGDDQRHSAEERLS